MRKPLPVGPHVGRPLPGSVSVQYPLLPDRMSTVNPLPLFHFLPDPASQPGIKPAQNFVANLHIVLEAAPGSGGMVSPPPQSVSRL